MHATAILRRLGIILVILTPALLLILAAQHSQEISNSLSGGVGDSADYISAASTLFSDGQLLDSDGVPMTIFPPGFPIVIAGLMHLGVPIETAVLVINVTSVVALCGLTYVLALQILKRTWIALLAVAVVGLNPSTLRVSLQAWTEPFFTALVVGLLWVLIGGLKRQYLSPRRMIASTILVWAAIWFRYIGIVLSAVFAFAVVMAESSRDRHRARIRAGAFLGIGLLGLVPIVARNLYLGSGPLGDRADSYLTFESALSGNLHSFGRVLVAPETSGLSEDIGVILAVLLLGGIWMAWVRRDQCVLLIGLCVVLYWLFLTASQFTSHVDPPGERFLVPILAPMVVLGLYAINTLLNGMKSQLEFRGQFWVWRSLQIGLALVTVGVILLDLFQSGRLAFPVLVT